jgi:protein gp37
MGKNSAIEWTDHSWNPWRGCHKVSQGCKNCYMFREQERYGKDPNIVVRSKTTFQDPLKWKDPAMVFTCSWSDFFIEEADPWRDEAWEIIKQTPHLTYQILTKRPERIHYGLPDDFFPRNVWWGISAENQDELEERWDILDSELHFHVPPIMFISAEPLLGPLDLTFAFEEIDCGDEEHNWWTRAADWVIVGGESGPDYRPMNPDWARDILKQCREHEVPYFMKQMGGWPKHGQIPKDLQICEFPDKGYTRS